MKRELTENFIVEINSKPLKKNYETINTVVKPFENT